MCALVVLCCSLLSSRNPSTGPFNPRRCCCRFIRNGRKDWVCLHSRALCTPPCSGRGLACVCASVLVIVMEMCFKHPAQSCQSPRKPTILRKHVDLSTTVRQDGRTGWARVSFLIQSSSTIFQHYHRSFHLPASYISLVLRRV